MKPALYYALVGGYSPHYLGYLKVMAVTSEKKNKHGELKLVYGRDCETGTQTNRTADSVQFTYWSEEAANKALAAAYEADKEFQAKEEQLDKARRELQRARSVEINRILSEHEYRQPSI